MSVRLSVRPCITRFLFDQKWVETNKNEISDDEAGRDYTSHDLFRVYELVFYNSNIGLTVGKKKMHALGQPVGIARPFFS